MRTPGKQSFLIVLCVMALMVVGAVPAAADPITQGRGYSYGLNAALAGEALIDQTPNCTAEIPPELEAFCEEILLEVPVEGVVESGTLIAENQVQAAGGLEGRLQQKMVDFAGEGVVPDTWGTVSYAATEDLVVADGLATADVIESESLATCVGGQPVFGSAANVANLALADTEILQPILDALGGIDLSPALNLAQEPNTLVVDLSPLIRITFWETNWDGATGTTDGSDTVWTNALHIEVLGGAGDLDPGVLEDLLGTEILDDVLGGLLGTEPAPEDPALPEDPTVPEDPTTEDPLGELPIAEQAQLQDDATLDIIVSHSEATAACEDREIGLGKTASSDTVAPGDTFNYNINVPNEQTCTLTGVRVVDTITGPAGFEIVSTQPTADSVEPAGTTATVTWNDIGPIAPGENVQLTIGVRVPANAPAGAQFREELRVTADCDGVPIDGALDFTGPTVGGGPALPRTGSVALLGGLAFMLFGAGLLRLRGAR